MKTIITLLIVLFIGTNYAQVTQYDSCTVQSTGCLNNMIVTANYTRNYSPCRDRITYTFTKASKGCDISNFVTNGARPDKFLTNCNSDWGSNGYNAVFCSQFGNIFSSPYKINTDSSCSNYVVVDMVVPAGDFVTGVIGLKGGTDCTTCPLKTYKPLADNINSIGACQNDIDCDDNNVCTIDKCNTDTTCSTCSNIWTDSLCIPCLNDSQCVDAPYIDGCTFWKCDSVLGKCESYTEENCFACKTDSDCPIIGEQGSTCIENICNLDTGICEQQLINDCCISSSLTHSLDACYICTKKTGCGFVESLGCVPLNSSNSVYFDNSTTSNCSISRGDGDGNSGDGVSGGTVAAIVVPIVAGVAAAGLAGAVVVAAIATLIAKYFQRAKIAANLQALGFNDTETNSILNSALYKEQGVENPFFITTNDEGARVLNIPN